MNKHNLSNIKSVCEGNINICNNQNKIFLTPMDVFSIALEKKKSSNYIIEEYCEILYTKNFPFPYLKDNLLYDLKRMPVICQDISLYTKLWFFSDDSSQTLTETNEFEKLLATNPFFNRWLQCVAISELLINKNEALEKKELYNIIIAQLYYDYDMTSPFLAQFDKKALELSGILGSKL